MDWFSATEPDLAGAAGHRLHLVRHRPGRRPWSFSSRRINRKVLDGMLGFAAGVMIAASFWSLLAPAIEMARRHRACPPGCRRRSGSCWAAPSCGCVDKMLPHLHLGLPAERGGGHPDHWQRSILLVLAITLHNIPEGLAVGVAFGAAAARAVLGHSLAGRDCPGAGHRHSELSRGGGRLHPAAPGGAVAR